MEKLGGEQQSRHRGRLLLMHCLITVSSGRTTVVRRKTDNDTPLRGQLILARRLNTGVRDHPCAITGWKTPRGPAFATARRVRTASTTTGAARSRSTDLAGSSRWQLLCSWLRWVLALLRRDAPGDDYSIKVVSAPEGRHFSEPVLFNIRTRLFSEIDGFSLS